MGISPMVPTEGELQPWLCGQTLEMHIEANLIHQDGSIPRLTAEIQTLMQQELQAQTLSCRHPARLYRT